MLLRLAVVEGLQKILIVCVPQESLAFGITIEFRSFFYHKVAWSNLSKSLCTSQCKSPHSDIRCIGRIRNDLFLQLPDSSIERQEAANLLLTTCYAPGLVYRNLY